MSIGEVEAWKALGDIGVNFPTKLFNQILETEEMPEEWRKSILVPIYKKRATSRTAAIIEA